MLTQLSLYTRDNIIRDVIGIEGGDSNNPDDSGGATNLGVTIAVAMKHHDELVSKFGWDGTMTNLTPPMAIYIYVQDYWNPLSLDGIVALGGKAPLVADLLFEAGVNMGINTVGAYFQQVLNVLNQKGTYYPDLLVDGNVGAKSIAAFQTLLAHRPQDGLKNVLFNVTAEIGHHYTAIALSNESQETFSSGWSNRARTQFETYVSLY